MHRRVRLPILLSLTVALGCAPDAGDDIASVASLLDGVDASTDRPRDSLSGGGGTDGRGDGGGADASCTVTISGGPNVCLDCQGGQQSTGLTAAGTPAGGTYSWSVTAGAERITLSSNKGPRAFARGVAPSVQEKDVTVSVTYAVKGTTCSNAVDLTVIKPTSLGVLADSTYVVANGAFNPPLPNGVLGRMGDVPGKVARDPLLVGALRVRSYEVRDQFGHRWLCNGILDETLNPVLPNMKVGDTRVTQGVVDEPDRLYYIARPTDGKKKNPTPNFPQTTVQTIAVSRCPVARFTLTFTPNSVDVQ